MRLSATAPRSTRPRSTSGSRSPGEAAIQPVGRHALSSACSRSDFFCSGFGKMLGTKKGPPTPIQFTPYSSAGVTAIMIPQPPTSRVVRRRQTWPSASRVRPGSAWSGWARWDRQRTMHTRGSPAAHPGLSRASTSADFRELAWTAVCESANRRYIHGQTDGRFIGQ